MNLKRIFNVLFVLTILLTLNACTQRRRYVPNEDRLSIATVQREIRIGMSSSDVVEVLGSPNMVTTDDQRRETWVYDKVSTNVESSSSGHGVWVLLYSYDNRSRTSSTTQRTLTIIVKFDKNNKVRDFAYRTSSF
ncbi:MAG: outer membrane protein assembly factor BamE [Bdellovibrionota bacterium]|nr:outer membrane protein assembly factor BamE [Bdellovibrionota bacterium]